MRVRALGLLVLAAVLAGLLPPAPARAADEFTMETRARYEAQPENRKVAVSVEVEFTNTTPDPPGQFSIFEEVLLAVHDGSTAVAARDGEGALGVEVTEQDGVTIATVTLREGVRHTESATFTLTYEIPDGGEVRVRPSVTVFPAWGFGTASEVTVALPAGYEVSVDGDELRPRADAERTLLVSDPIDDPAAWLALVTATRPSSFITLSAMVPLAGGTADLQVRAFEDDRAWGERTLEVLRLALPLLEQRIGLPYPRVGPLVVTESVGFGAPGIVEDAASSGEILVAFDQPPFTAIHQLAHVWLEGSLVEARWVGEGLASRLAADVGATIEVDPPFDPVARAGELEADAIPLDAWTATSSPAEERWAYAASWAFAAEVVDRVGIEAVQRVLQRAAAGFDPYEPVRPEAPERSDAPVAPLGTRSFLDHLENVSGIALAERFGDVALTPEDAALLDDRASARAAFDELLAAAGDWGSPDPVRAALGQWQFEDAEERIAQARDWLEDRDALLADMAAVGLSAPDRLRAAYRAHGGGADAVAELAAERAVVDAYAATLADANAERSFLERVGLLGGRDPGAELATANGRFAEGDLLGATEAIGEAQRLLDGAQTNGLVRIASAALVLVLLLALAVFLARRRPRYTGPR